MSTRSSFFAACVLVWPALRSGDIHGADCNENGLPDDEDITTGRSLDCNSNGVPDDCDLALRFGFAGPQLIPGSSSSVWAAEDFDGDGDVDLLTAERGFPGVAILWNDPAAAFLAGPLVPVGRSIWSVAASDVTGDGVTDLVVANGTESSITVLPGLGGGDFDPGFSFHGRGEPAHVIAEDLDGDGDRDLATANPDFPGDGHVIVFENAGSGGFAFVSALPAGEQPEVVLAADLDSDDDADLVATSLFIDAIYIFENLDGAFQPGVPHAVGSYPASLAAVDLDSDGRLDIVVGNRISASVSVLYGASADLDFTLRHTLLGAGEEPISLLVDDYDGDGLEDVVVSVRQGLRVLLNRGGALEPPLGFGDLAGKAISADLDGDGDRDIATVAGLLLIYENGLVTTSSDCDGNAVPDECEILGADCNRNGAPDSCDLERGASADCDENGVPDECDSRPGIDFSESPGIVLGSLFDSRQGTLMPGDLDGDGDQDWIALRSIGCTAFMNSGAGAFERMDVDAFGEVFQSLDLADMDADGDLDAIVVGDRVRVLSNEGAGRFEPTAFSRTDGLARAAVAADLNGDRRLDIAVLCWHDFGVQPLLRLPDGAFERGKVVPVGLPPLSIAAGDLDGDGLDDVAVGAGPTIWIHRNEGEGRFANGDVVLVRPSTTFVAMADLDGDRHIDVVGASSGDSGTGSVSVLWNDDRGTFAEPMEAVRAEPRTVAFADFDLDGRLDMLTEDHGSWAAIVLRNLGHRFFDRFRVMPLGLDPDYSMTADLDADGKVDAVLTDSGTASVIWNVTTPPRSADCDANGVLDACQVLLEDCDGNGIPDACGPDVDGDGVPDACESGRFRRGDANRDGRVDISDPLWILASLFLFREPDLGLGCPDASDADNDGVLNITDPIYLLDALFLGGKTLPRPGSEVCGEDSGLEDDLACPLYLSC